MSPQSNRARSVKIANLKRNLFVRSSLNEDHALHLAELLSNGVSLPPIVVNEDMVVIDGRHRIEAHELNDQDRISVVIRSIDDPSRLIAEAYKANAGGPLPPTPKDTEHTVKMLLEQGETIKRIGQLLRLPPGMARRYINEVKSRLNRAKILRAAAAVTDGGLTVKKAAEQHNVDLEKLKEQLSGKRRRQPQGIAEMQRQLTKTYRSLGSKNASLLRKLCEKFEDGDISEKQGLRIITKLESLQTKSAKSVADWKRRFEALNGNS